MIDHLFEVVKLMEKSNEFHKNPRKRREFLLEAQKHWDEYFKNRKPLSDHLDTSGKVIINEVE